MVVTTKMLDEIIKLQKDMIEVMKRLELAERLISNLESANETKTVWIKRLQEQIDAQARTLASVIRQSGNNYVD